MKKNDYKISPFTWTPGNAGKAFIDTHAIDEIIANFESKESAKYVYKIVGLRGSGKSVEYSMVMDYFNKKEKWLVYSLSAAGNPIKSLLASLSLEPFSDSDVVTTTLTTEGEISGKALIGEGAVSTSISKITTKNTEFYSDETALRTMIKRAKQSKVRILVGIDDIAKTDEMVQFLSVLGSIVLEKDNNVYLICTGLTKNIEDFTKEPHLSFFVRNESIEIEGLNLHDIAYEYQQLLDVSQAESIELAKFTKGYAFAYQVLGEIYYKKTKEDDWESLMSRFDKVIGTQYDLIWNSLTKTEQELVIIITQSETGKVSEIQEKMNNPKGFTSLRDRLIKKHVVSSVIRGYVSINLPRFKEYVELWKM